MNRLTFDQTGNIRAPSVVLLGFVLSGLALSLNVLLAGVAPTAFGVPSDLSVLGLNRLMWATIPAVLGNALGFYLAYRAPHPRALRKFLVPAAAFYGLFMIPHLWALLAGGTLGAFGVGALISTVPVALAVPVFLGLRPGTLRKPVVRSRARA